jgi:DNA-binding NarL/FixJ family response regulator
VVQAVFSVGASGYVVKVDAGPELLSAVNAVLRGETFIGSRFSGLALPAAHSLFHKRTDRHEVGFYSHERFLLDHLTQVVGTALKDRRAAIVIATECHRNSSIAHLTVSHRTSAGDLIRAVCDPIRSSEK